MGFVWSYLAAYFANCLIQRNGGPFFTLWKISSGLCCMCASSVWSWPWVTHPASRKGRDFSNTASNFRSPSDVWTKDIFTRGSNVRIQWCIYVLCQRWQNHHRVGRVVCQNRTGQVGLTRIILFSQVLVDQLVCEIFWRN